MLNECEVVNYISKFTEQEAKRSAYQVHDDGTIHPVEDHCCFICLRDTITSTLMARVPV